MLLAANLQEMPDGPPTYSSNPKPLPALSQLKGKFVFLAAGLAVIACLVLALSVRAWQSATAANRLKATTSAAALLPEIIPTTPAISSTSSAPAAALTATILPVTARAPPVQAITNPPTLATPDNTRQTNSQPTITWTPKYAGGRKMILYWNDSSFYMLAGNGLRRTD